MSPSDVMNRVITDPRLDLEARLDAIRVWGFIAENLREVGKDARDELSEFEHEYQKLVLRVVLESLAPRVGGVS